MPLKKGKKNIGKNMKELKSGPHHAKMARKFGAKKAHKIDVAIAMRNAGEGYGDGMKIAEDKKMEM